MAGNGLVEESYICKLLEGGSLDTLKESGLRDEMFLTCKDQIQFIQKHEAEYKQLPDKMIFLQKFKDFQMLEVTESMDYLADRIKEQFLYTKLVPIVQEGGNLLREDSLKAYDYLRAALETLQKDNPVSKNKEGVDIISSAKDRLESYLKRCEMKGLMGIPTGLSQLDDLTNGWLHGEELVVITGRTNVGKSWIAEFFGTMAWEAGYKILQYSGEMSVEMVGFRFDTLHKHFSNMGLLNGSGILGKKEDASRLNAELARKIAGAVSAYAEEHHSDVIVFEYLEMQGKIAGNKKQKLHLWRKRDIQKRCEHQAHRKGMRVSRICAWNTSRLAYDGSGAVLRDGKNHSLCTFSTGKRYHCDLSASYNIGARYFIRELLKPLPATERSLLEAKVPSVKRRTSCVYADLRELHLQMEILKAV